MNKSATLVNINDTRLTQFFIGAIQVVMGSLFLALMSQVIIPLPFSPVPITLQSLAVAFLAISLGSKKAPLAVIAYLFQATCALPVLKGGSLNPLWMVGPTAGYLIGFILSAYLIGKGLELFKNSSFLKRWAIIGLGECAILIMGTSWLGFFVGFSSAFTLGVLPFILGSFAKITLAASSIKPYETITKYLKTQCDY